jgi:predicted 3-demethylubiquinone-9 3-methyltransferase (glyoxalase superfamily)
MKPKNTICLWFDKDAHEAARFYAVTFPDSKVTAVHEAPGDYPGGKKGDVLTVEFTVLGIPCLGLNGGPAFRHTEAFSFQIATENQEETDLLLECDRRQWRHGKRVRLVQRPLGPVLADHPARANRCDGGRRR